MKPIKISSSILSADFASLGEAIRQAEQGGVDWIHIDVMDGHFVPNISMGPFIVETCNCITQLPLDVHLMIEKPELIAEAFIAAGADNLTIHIENNPNVVRTLQFIRSLGAHPAIAINPGTPISALESVLPFVDMVLVMTVNPGFSGQVFMPESLERIAELKKLAKTKNCPIQIEVDGGITSETIHQCREAGADAFVAATAIFKYSGGIIAGIQKLRESAD